MFHTPSGKRNAADGLNDVITTQLREETNLIRVENALEANVPMNNVTLPPPIGATVAKEIDTLSGLKTDADTPALPPPEYYVDELPTDFESVSKILDDFIDTRDPFTVGTTISDETPTFSPF